MGIKYSVNEEFFCKWTPVMAYVLGFIYADGAIYPSSRGKYLAVTSVDKLIIFKIKKWLNSHHKITTAKSTWTNGRLRYTLRIGNKNLYDSLVDIGLYPSKSLTIRLPEVPKKFLKDFARGYFDGDGCVYLYRSKGRVQKIIIRKLSVIFTSGSKRFLEDLLEALIGVIDLNQRKVYKGQRSYQLRFSTGDSVELFKFLYKNTPKDLFFKRKIEIFMGYFKLRPQRIDKEIRSVLQYLSSGHVVK